MLDILLSPGEETFEKLEICLRPSIRRQVTPFARDKMLRRTDDVDSLYNIALLKLHEAMHNFVWEPDLDNEHNERRFKALVNKYVRNAMIDEQYAANVEKRKPKLPLHPLTTCRASSSYELPSETFQYDLPDKMPCAHDCACANEIRFKIEEGLGLEEREILAHLCDGYSAEGIAGKMGLQTSRVRYVIYEKIQPRAVQFV